MKCMVNRIRPLLEPLISPFQSSFLPGRSTHDNIILAQELVHKLKHYQGNKGSMLLNIDLEKAYDKIQWSFLKDTLTLFNFPINYIDLIMSSLTSSSFSVLWNGAPGQPFSPQRGLRQGCPMSPYLFVLCLERLTSAIQNAVNTKAWKPINISRGGPGIAYMFFADDMLLCAEASMAQITTIKHILDD